MDVRALCLKLAKAKGAGEVAAILRKADLWNDSSLWRDYGDHDGNWSIVDNQQDSAEGALVEKITNSVDALLMRESWKRGMNPETHPNIPKTMSDAVSRFFGIHGGTLESAWDSEVSKLSNLISIVATGSKDTPCIHVIDRGIGQTPRSIPDTLMSLLRGNKNRIPFVQGQYNMGGTGAISFAGEEGLQLVISRRDPEVAEIESKRALNHGEEPDPTRDNWGFTITRIFLPEEGEKLPIVRYLAPQGEVLQFSGEPLDILPGDYPNAYGKEMEYGTFIKLYDYHSLGRLKTDICRNLIRRLDFLLFGLALPARLYERRSYRKDHYEAPLSGLSVVLSRNRAKTLEIEPISETISIEGNSIDFIIYILKKDSEMPYAKREGVAFLFNGQVQGWLPRSLFTQAELAYIDKHLLVIADTSRLPSHVRSKMFMGSRDRLKKNELTMQLEKEIVKMLKDQEEVVRINNDRRKQQIQEIREINTAVIEQIERLAKFDPTIRLLLNPGLKIHVPFDPRDVEAEDEYVGKEFPTFFVLESNAKRTMPRNHEARIFFKTDAANDYFGRLDTTKKGYYNLELVDFDGEIPFHRIGLSNGRATLRLLLPEKAKPGDVMTFSVRVYDQTQEFSPEQFEIEVLSAQPPRKSDSRSRRKPPGDKKGEDSDQPEEFGGPIVIPVHRHQWNEERWDEPWTEFCALRAKLSGQGGYDVYLNMDNFFVLHQIKRRRKKLPEEIHFQWESAMTLIAMAILSEDKRIGMNLDAELNDDLRPEVLLSAVSRALAPTILPIMNDF